MTATVARATPELRQIPIRDLVLSKHNPRTDVGDLSELEASIRVQGVLEPLIVVREDGHFAVVAGSRRLAAARKAQLVEVPAIVRDLSEEEQAAIALIENLQRTDLSPLEEARGYRSWLDLTKKTQAELAKQIGKAPSTIANALRLLEAPKPVQDALADGRITAAHARVALSVPEKALPLLDLRAGASVKQLEDQARVAQRSLGAYEKLKAEVERARAAGKTVTWDRDDREVWLGGGEFSLEAMFGKAPARIAGRLSAGQDWYGQVSTKTHTTVCDCTAVAIHGSGGLEPVCISPTGWKKAEAIARKNAGRAPRSERKKAQTAEQKRKAAERALKLSEKSADQALSEVVASKFGARPQKIDARFTKGGIDGEPARLALFGFAAGRSLRGKTWKVELWKKIAALPLRSVREKVAQLAVANAFAEIRYAGHYGGPNNSATIRRLVDAHYSSRGRKAAKR